MPGSVCAGRASGSGWKPSSTSSLGRDWSSVPPGPMYHTDGRTLGTGQRRNPSSKVGAGSPGVGVPAPFSMKMRTVGSDSNSARACA